MRRILRPRRIHFVAVLIAAFVITVLARVGTAARQSPSGNETAIEVRQALDKYCVQCHSGTVSTAGVALDALDVSRPESNADIWERVIRKLRSESMPPAGRPRPDAATYRRVAGWLEGGIDRHAKANPNPGRTSPAHRLNRAEYYNAVRDLLGVEVDASGLPFDDTSDTGFDNNADVLSITPAQLERYLSLARRVSRLAVGLPPGGPVVERFAVPNLLLQDDRRNEDLPLGSRGGLSVRYDFPVDGEYLIKVRLLGNYQDYLFGMGTPQQLDIRIDGALQGRLTVGGNATGRAAPSSFTGVDFGDLEWERYVREGDDHLEVRVPVKAGPRQVSASFVRNVREPEGILQPRQGGSVLSNDELFLTGNARVGELIIGGPHRVDGLTETPSRREIFVCAPAAAMDERPCAERILSRLARRAFRRPATAADVQMLLTFFERGRSAGKTFDAGIQLAIERLLVDPDFLLRIGRAPAGAVAGRPYSLAPFDLASRLSFFLWSSIPDEALLTAAEDGTLTRPIVLEQQVRRMLADPRARALVDNFTAQWLHLRRVADVVGDPLAFPEFDQNLVEAFQQETELLLASTLHEDRSVLELLTANYTHVNERLARHYGIPGIYGSRFRRVPLPEGGQRSGVLGHGAVLALTSYPTRTSPVLRGKWLLETILGAPPPPPPPDVPDLPERGENGVPSSVRQRLEQHRRSPQCASCHAVIDPLGFALEHFDGLGAWRSEDEAGRPVDATGTMPDGTKVQGLPGLRAYLLDRREQFAGTVAERLMAYAVGRELRYFDRPAIREIVRNAAAQEYRWSSLILGVVRSPAFLMRNAQPAE